MATRYVMVAIDDTDWPADARQDPSEYVKFKLGWPVGSAAWTHEGLDTIEVPDELGVQIMNGAW